MTYALGPVSELRFRADASQKDMDEVCSKVRQLEKDQVLAKVQAATVAGAVSAIIFIVKFLIWK